MAGCPYPPGGERRLGGGLLVTSSQTSVSNEWTFNCSLSHCCSSSGLPNCRRESNTMPRDFVQYVLAECHYLACTELYTTRIGAHPSVGYTIGDIKNMSILPTQSYNEFAVASCSCQLNLSFTSVNATTEVMICP